MAEACLSGGGFHFFLGRVRGCLWVFIFRGTPFAGKAGRCFGSVVVGKWWVLYIWV